MTDERREQVQEAFVGTWDGENEGFLVWAGTPEEWFDGARRLLSAERLSEFDVEKAFREWIKNYSPFLMLSAEVQAKKFFLHMQSRILGPEAEKVKTECSLHGWGDGNTCPACAAESSEPKPSQDEGEKS